MPVGKLCKKVLKVLNLLYPIIILHCYTAEHNRPTVLDMNSTAGHAVTFIKRLHTYWEKGVEFVYEGFNLF